MATISTWRGRAAVRPLLGRRGGRRRERARAEEAGTREAPGTAETAGQAGTAGRAETAGQAGTAGGAGTAEATGATASAASAASAPFPRTPAPPADATHTPTAPAPEPAPAPAPALSLQINALQALCRQVFGFRLAMIALAAPAALLNTSPGLGAYLVGAAVVVTFMGSYALFRDWERFGPLLLRHPALLAADTLFGSLLLISAGPDTTLAYVSVCTPLLAGLAYSWRGAACFASLQALILLLVQATLARAGDRTPAEALLLPGLCVIAGAVGSTLRNLMLRFGEATHALTAVQARLAAAEAVAAERARMARELHDSVAKTLHGVALAADGLAASASAPDPDAATLRRQADLVARSARRAAAESRELLTDLRRASDAGDATDLHAELAARTVDFTARTSLPAAYHRTGDRPVPALPPAVARQLLAVTAEAMENAYRHAAATRVEVRAGVEGDRLSVSVYDDGRGLPPGTTLDQLHRAGHFGLVGMVERAAAVGARIRIGRGTHPHGTEVRLDLPLAALTTTGEAG
ncbi:sensor histidine kinase [Streptomyces sp. NPDC001595]|uniref:sensor histidine kinase n=1 Tax=Streptomyces sp. NPDC001532 TaxID=3154520 RepID=UPI00332BC494